MTWLDLVCAMFVALVAVGGYAQGLIRGLLRLAALLVGGTIGILLMLRLGALATARMTAIWALVATGLGVAASGAMAWAATGAVPRRTHESTLNRLFGILPALAIGFVVLALVLGLAERVAIRPSDQAFIRSGLVTGPLVELVDRLEQTLVRLP
jgi:uncharacterized membrane protein required for colicin V production